MIRLLFFCSLGLLPMILPAQDKAIPSLQQSYQSLLTELDRKVKPLDKQHKLQLLQQFLDKHLKTQDLLTDKNRKTTPARTSVFAQIRIRMGLLYLQNLQAKQALQQFQQASRNTHNQQRMLRARAIYGESQCLELLGKRSACLASLSSLTEEYADTRFGRFALIAMGRLRAKKRQLRTGQALPEFGPLLDLQGKSHSMKNLQGQPALLLFWSPDSPVSIQEAQKLLDTWLRGGGRQQQALCFAVHQSTQRIKEIVTKQKWQVPVIPCSQDFLDPLILDYQVDSLPSSFLAGPDGMNLGRDLTQQKLAEALQVLLGG